MALDGYGPSLEQLQRENLELQNALNEAKLKEGQSRLTKVQAILGVAAIVFGLVATVQTIRLNQLAITEHHERDQSTREILHKNQDVLLAFMDKLINDTSTNLDGEDREAAALTAAFFLLSLGSWNADDIRYYADVADHYDERNKSCMGSYVRVLINDLEFRDLESWCQTRINVMKNRR